MREVFAAAFALLAATAANAADADRCEIVVGGVSYMDEPCEYSEADGVATIGVVDAGRAGGHFAYVIDGQAYWNGAESASKAHYPLGSVERDGACWVNAKARLCVEFDELDLMGN